jgi:hypothetical protein
MHRIFITERFEFLFLFSQNEIDQWFPTFYFSRNFRAENKKTCIPPGNFYITISLKKTYCKSQADENLGRFTTCRSGYDYPRLGTAGIDNKNLFKNHVGEKK